MVTIIIACSKSDSILCQILIEMSGNKQQSFRNIYRIKNTVFEFQKEHIHSVFFFFFPNSFLYSILTARSVSLTFCRAWIYGDRDCEVCSQSTRSSHEQVGQLSTQWEGLLDVEVMTDVEENETVPKCNVVDLNLGFPSTKAT